MEEADKQYKVIVSKRATEMLVAHTAFLAKASKSAAQQLVKSFRQATASLEKFPQRCPWLFSDYIPSNKYRYLIFDKRYLLIYQIRDDTVYLDYVLDCRQDYGWLLR